MLLAIPLMLYHHCRNTVDGLQKVMGQMEQDQAMLGKKVHRLQESLKSCKKVCHTYVCNNCIVQQLMEKL